MIFTERTIKISNGVCEIDNPIVLYRGDYNVEVRFTIIESPFKYTTKNSANIIEDVKASYGQLVIKVPNDGLPIFSDVVKTNEGSVVFTISGEMIDESIEVGDYTFQIRLFDANKESRATIPPVENGISIREPIAFDDVTTTNEVGEATVGYALTTAAIAEDTFDSQGNYNKTIWGTGDRITAAKLNKIEAGIDGVNQKVASGGTSSNNAGDISIADTGNYFTSTNVEGALQEAGSQIKEITNSVGGGNVSGTEPNELDMPKVFIYGDALPTSKTDVLLTMDYISNTDKFSSYIKLKCQGTSSMSYAKKNFTVNMYSDEARATKLKKDFKGWGEQSKFCLKANWVDTTHTRNISGARIGYDMIQSRPDSTFKQQLLTAPRYGLVDGFPIKLYFNGEFYGIYTWNIPKDAWQFNMNEDNPNHCVLCAEVNTDGTDRATSCNFRKLWNGSSEWSVEVGTASAEIIASFDRCIGFVMNATDDDFKANIGQYFDLYSLLDYYCFSYLTNHLDGLAKNMLMATYDGVIWGASLYDMDSIYGVSWNGGSFVATNYKCPEQYQEQFSLLWKRIEECFGVELYARYLELRQGALSLSNIIKHVEEIYDVIPDRVFTDEKAKWTSLPQVANNTMTRFRNYMRDRAVYVDAQMEEIGNPPTEIPCTGISLNKSELTLGRSEDLGADDSNVNYLEGVQWELGSINTSGALITSTTDYRCQVTDLPIGVYTLHHDTYTWKKVSLKNGDEMLIGSNPTGNGNTDDATFTITNPNTIVNISVFPNGVTPITGVSLTRTNITDIQEYSVAYTDLTIPTWASNVDSNYLLLQVNLGSSSVIDITKLVNIHIGNEVYYVSYTNSSNSSQVNQLSYKCNSLIYNNTVYVNIGLLKSKYGNTLADFQQYCSNNGITNIYINKDVVQGGATTTKLTEQLVATVEPSNTTDTITWSSNAPSIATVNNGLVTAKANGEATITATCGTQSATCNVSVSGLNEESKLYTEEIILQNYIGTGSKIENFYGGSIDFTTQYIEANIDCSACNYSGDGNILSISDDISKVTGWSKSNTMHIAYKPSNSSLIIFVLNPYTDVNTNEIVVSDPSNIKLLFNKDGIYINDELITSEPYGTGNMSIQDRYATYISSLTTIYMNCSQGSNPNKATIKKLSIFTKSI